MKLPEKNKKKKKNNKKPVIRTRDTDTATAFPLE